MNMYNYRTPPPPLFFLFPPGLSRNLPGLSIVNSIPRNTPPFHSSLDPFFSLDLLRNLSGRLLVHFVQRAHDILAQSHQAVPAVQAKTPQKHHMNTEKKREREGSYINSTSQRQPREEWDISRHSCRGQYFVSNDNFFFGNDKHCY